MTDLAGNFTQPFAVGTIAATTTATVNNIVIAFSNGGLGPNIDITIPNPFAGGGTITIPNLPQVPPTNTVTIPNPFGASGTTTATVTITTNPIIVTITIPNPVGGGGTIVITNAVIGSNTGTATTTIIDTPCIPNTYHLSVQQLTTHALYHASVSFNA
jgi:hypothetical protein